MEMTTVVITVGAVLLGALVGLLIGRRGRSADQAERVGLQERLRSRDEELTRAAAVQGALDTEVKNLRLRVEDFRATEATLNTREEELARSAATQELLRAEIRDLQSRVEGLRATEATLTTRVDEVRKLAEEKELLLKEAQGKLTESFEALSGKALKANSESFLALAKTQLETFQQGAKAELEKRQQAIDELMKPIKDTIGKVDQRIEAVEKERRQAYGSLSKHLETMAESQARLQSETQNLVKALRAPTVRGRWGEIQLRRVVEIAGMVEYCDFLEQEGISTDDGLRRPDLIVKLPGGKQVVIDAKAPLQHYLEAVEATDEDERASALQEHARQVR